MQINRKVYKRRTNKVKKSRILSFFYLLILFLVLAFTFAYLSLYGLSHWNLLNIKEIEIKGTHYINENLLYLRLASIEAKNLFAVNDSRIKEILSEYTRIKSFKVIRQIPNTLKILIQERIPIACLSSSNDTMYLIDNEGVVLDYAKSSAKNDLPIFKGINTNNLTFGRTISDKNIKVLLNIYNYIKQENPDFVDRISEFDMEDGEVILIENKRNVKFLLGSEKFQERIDKLIFAYQNFGIANFSEIDLRFSDPKNEIIILR